MDRYFYFYFFIFLNLPPIHAQPLHAPPRLAAALPPARDGRLFHVDFGHFLGNVKTKFGVKRETAPFSLTPDIARVMGGPRSYGWIQFVQLSCRAYNSLRRRHRALLTLFEMMLGAGLPNLNARGRPDRRRPLTFHSRSARESSLTRPSHLSLAPLYVSHITCLCMKLSALST